MTDTEVKIGGRIKKLRRQRKLSQADCADALGISASYLNLIEHNRRRVTVSLLMKMAAYFGVEAGELAENEEPRLTGDLMELFGDDIFEGSDVTNHDIRDLVNANPAVGRAIVRLFDKYRALRTQGSMVQSAREAGYHAATDAVSDFLQANSNYFPVLEAAAETLRARIGPDPSGLEQGLRAHLASAFGLQWRAAALPEGVTRRLDAARGELLTDESLPPESSLFEAARQLAFLGAKAEIDAAITAADLPDDAPAIARNVLASYFAAALIMPYEAFHGACRETRYDIERIARRFKASFEQVCHRMTTLQRPGRSGIPMHLIRTDIAGNISKRFSRSGIQIPRHSGACPRWNVYTAFLHPQQINVQVSQMPEGQRYFCVARSLAKGGDHHHAPRRHLSIGLGCHIGYASEMVYSDGVDIANPGLAVPIGIGCRICPRQDCGQRAHPPSDQRIQLDEGKGTGNFYVRG